MTTGYLLFALLAALGFYGASAHQRGWPAARAHARRLRAAAWVFVALSMGLAIAVSGLWAGLFASLTALMLALVLLPYADAWMALRRTRQP